MVDAARQVVGPIARDVAEADEGPLPRSCQECERGVRELRSGRCVPCQRCHEHDGYGLVPLQAACAYCGRGVTYEHGIEALQGVEDVVLCSAQCAAEWLGEARPSARAFDARLGPGCAKCGLPALLHQPERCEEEVA